MNSSAVDQSTEPVDAQVNGNCLAAGEIRLNLGGRGTHIPGFVTVDLEDGSDIVSDVANLSLFKDGSVSEIYASHILEHFPHGQTLSVLKEWRRVLKKHGKLYISVPDFDVVVRLYLAYPGLNDFLRNFMYGDQLYPRAYHYTIFTFNTLAGLIAQAGFDDVQRIDVMPYGIKDCSKLMDTFSNKPISLNVEAMA